MTYRLPNNLKLIMNVVYIPVNQLTNGMLTFNTDCEALNG